MNKFILSVICSSFVISAVGCSNQALPLANGVQSFAAKTPAGPPRSNAVLDAVAKRARFVMFQSSDRNRDGQIGPQEFAMPGFNLAAYDKNKDGQLNFTEFDTAMLKLPAFGINRDALRQQAQMMWQQINKDNNQVLLRSEVEDYFTAPYNNQPMPYPAPPTVVPTAMPTDTPASSYPGDPYGGYPTQPNWEQLKYEARRQAIDFFVQADVNLDQALSFSEYEDGYAKQMLSSAENSLSNNYGYFYPYPGSGYGSSYPVATALPRR